MWESAAVVVLAFLAGLAPGLLALWRNRHQLRESNERLAQDKPETGRGLAEVLERLGELEARQKATDRKLDDLDESWGRRWNRLNKRETRDAAEAPAADSQDPAQGDLLTPAAGVTHPAFGSGRLRVKQPFTGGRNATNR